MAKNFEKEYRESFSRAKKILGNCDEPIDTNVKEAIEAIFPALKSRTDDQKWEILKSMVHSNIPDNIYDYYKLDREDFESWLVAKGKEISVLREQIESLYTLIDPLRESKHKPVVSEEVIREGIAHFGITQHQIDNWLKKHFNVVGQDPCTDCKHPMLNCHNFPCMEKIAFSNGKTIYEVMKQGQLNKQEIINCSVGPEFHEGNWVVRGDTVAQILDIQEQYYIGRDTNGKDFVSSRFLDDNKIHLWTIQDAKDGDVLVTVNDENRPFIYKGCFDPNHPDSPVAYCGIDADGYFYSGGGKFNHWWTVEKVQPATKEQRDTLMKAMTDAGYTFDFDKKELKEVAQKSAE